MFMSFFADRSRPVLGVLGTAWEATVHPVRTGQSIVIGSREDFDRRVTFFISVAGVQLVIQTLVAAALGVSVMPSSFDSLLAVCAAVLCGADISDALRSHPACSGGRSSSLPSTSRRRRCRWDRVFLQVPFTLLPSNSRRAELRQAERR